MGLLQDWREYAYGVDINSKAGQAIWAKYFNEEKAVYEQLLANPEEVVSGTVKELADKYNMELKYMVGFLDGINESLNNLSSTITGSRTFPTSTKFLPFRSSRCGNKWQPTKKLLTVPPWRAIGRLPQRNTRNDNGTSGHFVQRCFFHGKEGYG